MPGYVNGLNELGHLPGPAKADLDTRYAKRGDVTRNRLSLIQGDDRIRRMAAGPAYAPVTMAAPPTVTESTTLDAALTKSTSQNRTDIFQWDAPNPTGATPRYWTFADGSGVGASVPVTQFRFDTDADHFAFLLYGRSGQTYRIWINEEAVTANMVAVVNHNVSTYVHVNFGSYSLSPRRVVIEIESPNAPIQFYGVRSKAAASILPPQITGPRGILVADSFGVGAGALRFVEGYGRTLGRLLGIADFWTNFGSLSATGIVQAPSAISGNYRSRLEPDVIPSAPDLVILQGSQNDRPHASAGTITPAIVDYVNTLKAALPDCRVVIVGLAWVANPDATLTSINDQWRTAAGQMGVPFVDLLSPVQYFTGTGNTSTPTGDGNADRYRNPDNSHPSQAGHDTLARILAGRIRSVI